jgi:hypothetical protein
VKGATAILAGLVTVAVLLLGAELISSATSSASPKVANPCLPRAPYAGHGIDGTIQRIVLDGLDGAACQLHTTREQLVLSLGPGTEHRHWTRAQAEAAIRAGLLRAVDEADQRGDIPSFLVPALRRLIAEAPIDRIVEGGFKLSDLLG